MKKKIIAMVVAIVATVSLIGCGAASFQNDANVYEEKTGGKSYTAKVYDSYGTNTLNVSGKKVSLDVLKETSNIFSDLFSDENDTTYVSNVLDVTIDGSQILMVGDTVIFEEDGLDMVTDFEVSDIQSNGGGSGLQFFDRSINKYANFIGKAKVVVVSSQLGVPIGIYQGEDVYVEVPDDLPKTTRLSIDGKSLYIHRANYQIIDANLLK